MKRLSALEILSKAGVPTVVMMGPIMGPTLGGYLTDLYSWRYVFYVNLPFGILAIAGLAYFMPDSPPKPDLRILAI